jgi:demethylmenaquinone methyltransferase/2-methoxy-6-polyprenyl-1,4-benzoquinol methylase
MVHAPPTRPGDPDGSPRPTEEEIAGGATVEIGPVGGRRPDHADRRDARPDDGVAALFDDIAPVYDRLSRIASFGRDRRWRAAAVDACALGAGDAVVDVFAGTGRLAAALADRVGPFGRVVAVDFSPRMVERGTVRNRDIVQLEFVQADARSLPFDDGRFDAATVSFGLRTLPDVGLALAEMRRVVRPGGRVVCLERVMPRPRIWGRTYRAAVRRLVPLTGAMSGRRAAYSRLESSLERVPEATELSDAMRSAGLVEVTYRRFWLGAVALLVGVTPPATGQPG